MLCGILESRGNGAANFSGRKKRTLMKSRPFFQSTETVPGSDWHCLCFIFVPSRSFVIPISPPPMAKQTAPSVPPALKAKTPAAKSDRGAAKEAKRRKVAFTIQVPHAHEAAVAGSFNDWQPQPLKAAKSPGSFSLTVLLPPGDYEYRFVIDGQWCNDAACPESVPNPFGESNSLLRVA
jgi:hypothetical protein